MAQLKKEEGLLEWFQGDVLPGLISNGQFGKENLMIEKLEYEITKRGVDHFASCPYFCKLATKSEEGEAREHAIVVKFTSQDAAYRAAMDTDGQFSNEAAMYNLVLPAFDRFLKGTVPRADSFIDDVCPHCYHASYSKTTPEKSLIVLEDLREKGFRVAESKVELDFAHCAIALKKLGKFHAVSYAMKKKDPGLLNKLKSSYVEVRYPDDAPKEQWNNLLYGRSSQRAIEYLRKVKPGVVPEEYLQRFLAKVTHEPYTMMQSLVIQEEPLSTIVHGDFCRNNVLFKYHEGKPVDCRLFDFQTYRYSSPAVDLAFFFYMNTTLELREARFDELFRMYHDAVLDTVAAVLEEPRVEVERRYPLKAFLEDYAEKAVFGYMIAAFFLPMMMAPPEDPSNFEEEFLSRDPQEFVEELFVQGGDVVSDRIAEVVVDFYRRGYYASD